MACGVQGPKRYMSSLPRVIIASPYLTESEALADWLHTEGVTPVRKATAAAATDELRLQACDAIVADAGFAFRDRLFEACRAASCNRQTPLVLVGEAEAATESRAEAVGAFYLRRPIDRASLVCTVSMALMEGRPIRRSPRKRIGRFEAVAHGVPAHIIDVSKEGLRLEIARGRRATSLPPPYFSVRIPMVGVALTVQRIWVSAENGASALACGGTLARNRPDAEQGWHTFIAAAPEVNGPA